MHRKQKSNRFGGAAVEAALVSPLLVLVLLGAIDIGQYVNIAQSVSNASREGARVACRNQTQSVSEVEACVTNYLHETFPYLTESEIDNAIEIEIRDETNDVPISSDLTEIASGDIMSVKVEMDFDTVRWLRGVDYWDRQFKTTTTVIRRE